MFGRGLSLSSIVDLYERRPPGSELVLFIEKRLWLVELATLTGCKLVEVVNLKITNLFWETDDPQPTNYWYMPFFEDKITYPSLAFE